jgi:hypothetical protein
MIHAVVENSCSTPTVPVPKNVALTLWLSISLKGDSFATLWLMFALLLYGISEGGHQARLFREEVDLRLLISTYM